MHRRTAVATITLGAIAGMTGCQNTSSPILSGGLGSGPLRARTRDDDGLQHHTIMGGGGCRLHVVEAGNPRGPSILFLHGFSQNALTWQAQLGSDLGGRFRLIAPDMRGHGLSERPQAGYDDGSLWADDVDAIIRELKLERPVLSIWSYGPFLLDYIRKYGDARVGGLHFVSAISKLGSQAALAVLTPEVLALVPGLFSTDAQTSVSTLESFIRLFFAQPPSASELYKILGYNATVPVFVRQALFSRTVDNDDVMATIRKPVLITHGTRDALVKVAVVDQHRALMPHAQIHMMTDVGHLPQQEDPASFNQRLAAFCNEVARAEDGK